MLLLYIDESGTFDKDLEHSVVGGVAVHVADVEHFRHGIEEIVSAHLDEHNRSLELHANLMRSGSKEWRKIPQNVRRALLERLVTYLGSYRSPSGRPFGLLAVVRAPHAVPGVDPLERVFEELLFRFRSMLDRHSSVEEPLFGVVVADEAKHEKVVQPLVLKWRQTGMRRRPWLGRLDRIVEVPLFVDSSTTRLLQAADIVAHSTYQHYERGDPSWLDPLLPAFDAGAGVLHGLVHLCPGYRNCTCPACVSRVARDRMRAAALRLAKQRRTPEAALHRFSA